MFSYLGKKIARIRLAIAKKFFSVKILKYKNISDTCKEENEQIFKRKIKSTLIKKDFYDIEEKKKYFDNQNLWK